MVERGRFSQICTASAPNPAAFSRKSNTDSGVAGVKSRVPIAHLKAQLEMPLFIFLYQ
jgi:hypothetical protein